MTVEEAEKVTNQDIARYLGGLPEEKMHCSVMGREALEAAIAHYKGIPEKEIEGQIVCECFGVTDREIERAIRENHLTTRRGGHQLHQGGRGLRQLPRSHSGDPRSGPRRGGNRAHPKPKLSNIQKIRMIEETIEREIRPSLKHDGGDIELIDVIGNRVIVATRGACASCQASNMTLKNFVETEASRTGLAGTGGRGGFPMKTIYLDNNATTQVAPEVLEAMLPYFHELYGNPSSMHTFGGQVGRKLREAREQVAALLGASPDEIIFTSCGSESDNAAIRSALASQPGKRHIVTSRVEHPAVRALCAQLVNRGISGHRTAGGRRRPSGHGAVPEEPHPGYGHREPHVGQQRNRGDLSR